MDLPHLITFESDLGSIQPLSFLLEKSRWNVIFVLSIVRKDELPAINETREEVSGVHVNLQRSRGDPSKFPERLI